MLINELTLTSRRVGLLVKMGIKTVEDLLKYYPLRYETRQAKPFDEWQEKENVTFSGLICAPARVIRLSKNRSMTKFKVMSWNEELNITLFNRPWPSQFGFGKTIVINGAYQGNCNVVASNYSFKPIEEQLGIHPVYPLVEGLKQSDIQAIMKKALEYVDIMPQRVPQRYVDKYRLLDTSTAYKWIHFPENEKQLYAAVRSLKYEEFLCFQCVMQAMHVKKEIKDGKTFEVNTIHDWISKLPFELTQDQQSSIDSILYDMKSSSVMFRLVQGDVGCGKSIVAFVSMYANQLAGFQSAMLAPTEILARQHVENMHALGLEATLYVSSLPTKEKKDILARLEEGSIQNIVGTHALFQEGVVFKKLGLVIADEQQRFGVRQRKALLEKGKNVDFLMMSATPIPRTYAHFLYGDMDISSIHTMPKGRKLVETKYFKTTSMKPVLQDVLDFLKEGRQCYVVCPAIEENDEYKMRNVFEIYEGMTKTLKDVRIGLLHGKMTSLEKEEVMSQFQNHELDILVSTTVIEVGIDVKNATVMVIYDAHRFGLSTLHQLRGRVARGSKQGYCFLLSGSNDAQAIERLKKLEELKDGFAISEYDLHMRGPGDILGIRQSGMPCLVFGDLEKDKAMMEACIQDAQEILMDQQDTDLLLYISNAIENAQYFD
jgi:ATP-dependent DNA helicase RecG